jgi:hypothetical protein
VQVVDAFVNDGVLGMVHGGHVSWG